MTFIRYEAGHTHTLVRPKVIIMVGTIESDLIADVWGIVSSPTWDVADVIDRLAVSGLAELPDFALVLERESTLTILARGSISVTVDAAGETEEISGKGVSTWREVVTAKCVETRVTLNATPSSERETSQLPISDGVVLASRVVVGPEAGPVPAAPEVPPKAVMVETPEVLAPAATERVEPEPVETEERSSVSEPDTSGEGESELEQAEHIDPEVQVAPSSHSAHDPNMTMAESDPSSKFDAMFGQTIAGRRLEDAAVREQETPRAPPNESPATPVAGASGLGDHSGDTMSAAALANLRAGRQAPAPSAPKEPARQRNTTATLRLSTGKVVELQRPVVLGRSPRAHGSTTADLPQLVVIDNPYVSGTHLMVAIEDDVVLATDLSTNGTLITRPGAEPVRLDKSRAVAVTDGCILALADGVTIEISITRGGSQ